MLRFITTTFFAFHTSSTGMPAMGLEGSSCAAGLTMSLAPITIATSVDRKSTRLNSSHTVISYAVFCLKKKKTYALHILPRCYGSHLDPFPARPPKLLRRGDDTSL